jgi:hypothetical protein
MRKTFINLILAALTTGALMLTVPAIAEDTAHYSVETTLVEKLLDDPVTNELLKKMIPSVYANEMFQSMGRSQTLRYIQQFEPDLNDETLAKIQAELDKIPAKS